MDNDTITRTELVAFLQVEASKHDYAARGLYIRARQGEQVDGKALNEHARLATSLHNFANQLTDKVP